MEWKSLYKIDKTRVLWFFLSIPLSALLSLLLFLLLEAVFRLHIPFWAYIIFSLVTSYFVGFVVDTIHSNLEEHHHKLIFYIIKAIAIIASVVLLFVFFFVFFAERTMVAKKPALYLYPEQDTLINVKLDVNGKIIKDIPEYNGGWEVFVTKEGIIEHQYDYLFYEAELNKIGLPNEGWSVKYDDLEEWFGVNLNKLGLNDKEASQFKEFWLKNLPRSEYYEIKMFSDDYLKDNMNLVIEPEPDTLIRLLFYFKPIDKKISLKKPVIRTPERKGFVAVEWGGVLEE